jgi:PAS domain S-box-containing protein
MIHQGGYIKFANDTALKLAGSFLNDTIDSFILDFVHPENKEIAQKRLSSSNAGEEVSEVFEVKIINKDGTPMDVEVKRVDITFQGEKSVLLFIRDITERKRLQETLIQSEKMLSLGGLAAGMAHEINNPLAGIMQNAQVIMNRLEKDSPANRKSAEELGISLEAVRTFLHERKIFNHLRRIRESGSRAAEIITNMLNFARKEISKSTHDLRELLDKTVEMAGLDYDLKKKYDFRAIKIVRNYEEDLPLVPCDQGQIQQVFFNILKNGAEAMQESQEKEGNREESQFTLSAKQEGESVRVEIQNNLSGIPKELQGRIFEPFYTTKPVGAGTGLGLSVSYFIIKETHGGKLEVESDGSTWVKFIIELPVADH